MTVTIQRKPIGDGPSPEPETYGAVLSIGEMNGVVTLERIGAAPTVAFYVTDLEPNVAVELLSA